MHDSSVLRVHPDTALHQVAGHWMAATALDEFHTFEGSDGAVSEVAERIVSLVDGRRTVAEIVDVIVTEFEVSRAECAADTREFIDVLVQRQILALEVNPEGVQGSARTKG